MGSPSSPVVRRRGVLRLLGLLGLLGWGVAAALAAGAGCSAPAEEAPGEELPGEPDAPPGDAPPDGPGDPGTPPGPPNPPPPVPPPPLDGELGTPFAYSALQLTREQSARRPQVVTTAVSNFTLEAWVRWDGAGGRQIVLYNGDPVRNGYGLVIDGGLLRVLVGGVGWVTCTTCRLPAGAWAHVAAVRTSVAWILLINGAIGLVTDEPMTPNPPAGGFAIGAGVTDDGRGNGKSVDGFRGALDEVRVWSAARAPQQISGDLRGALFGDEAGLAAYYRLDEGRGQSCADASGHGRTATLTAGPDQSMPAWIASAAPLVSGLARTALRAPGLTAPAVATTAVDRFTLEAWIRWDGSPQAPIDAPLDAQTVLYNGEPGSSGYGLSIVGGRPRIILGGLGGAGSIPCETCSIPVGAWTHLALVHGDGSWRLYQNGTLALLSTAAPEPIAPAGGFSVAAAAGGGERLRGFFDEVRIWTVARDSEVRAAARTSLRGDEPGLVHYYRFDEEGPCCSDVAGTLRLAPPAGVGVDRRSSEVPLVGAVRAVPR